MSHALTKEELLAALLENPNTLGQSQSWLSQARNWQDELIAFDYFLAQLLERCTEEDEQNLYLKNYFDLEATAWWTREDFGMDFITYLLSHLRDTDLSLEEQIVHYRDRMDNHQYDRSLRY
ncbi:MAG: hypothetical protein COA78_10430 [Blastopirellula sp.]|nr:MAG: hypothetical protein COA78_10430 [Blastopirellula sp.]